jgi:hypothetical protein
VRGRDVRVPGAFVEPREGCRVAARPPAARLEESV